MTTSVKFSVARLTAGGSEKVTGKVRFEPVRRFFNKAKTLILPFPFDVDLVNGAATVGLEPTGDEFVWMVTVIPSDESKSWMRLVEVPDSTSAVDYADLVEVDANTLTPTMMNGSAVMKYMVASSVQEAERLSEEYPNWMVFVDTTAAASTAAASLAEIAQCAAEARSGVLQTQNAVAAVQNDATAVAALHEDTVNVSNRAKTALGEVEASASAVAATVDELSEKSRVVAMTAESVEASAQDAASRVAKAVETVEASAQDGSSRVVKAAETVEASAQDGASRISKAVETVEQLAAGVAGEPTVTPAPSEGDASEGESTGVETASDVSDATSVTPVESEAV